MKKNYHLGFFLAHYETNLIGLKVHERTHLFPLMNAATKTVIAHTGLCSGSTAGAIAHCVGVAFTVSGRGEWLTPAAPAGRGVGVVFTPFRNELPELGGLPQVCALTLTSYCP